MLVKFVEYGKTFDGHISDREMDLIPRKKDYVSVMDSRYNNGPYLAKVQSIMWLIEQECVEVTLFANEIK